MISLNLLDLLLDVPFAHKNRQHLFLTLENGLRCFLINDSTTDLVSGAVVTNSGNFNDPPEAPGIAHLAEHIMMRGPRKKDSNDIDHLIASSGGSFNAYTSAERTCFYFEISTYAQNTIDREQFVLDSFLPVFASRLEKPYISDKAIRLEITAVDNEHNGNRSNLAKIYLHALRLLSNPIHPFSRFGSGNISTLSNEPLNRIKSLVSSHISRSFNPHNMVLALKGPQSLIHLRKLVTANFSNLKLSSSSPLSPKSLDSTIFDGYSDIPLFGENNCIIVKTSLAKGMRILISLKNINHLPNYGPVLRLLCNLIGDESIDTLCDTLKRKLQWAHHIYVFIQEICQGEEMIVIEIDTTTQGQKRVAQLKEAVLFYVEKVIFEVPEIELLQLALNFEHIERYNYLHQDSSSTSLEEVCAYAERITTKNLRDEDLIRGFNYWNNIKNAHNDIQFAIKACFQRKNWKIIVLDSDFRSMRKLGGNINRIIQDSNLDFEYMRLVMSFDDDAYFEFKIPKIDKKIQKLAPIMQPDMHTGKLTKIRDLISQGAEPKLFTFENGSEVWHQYSSPKDGSVDNSVVSISIKFPHVPITATNMVILELLSEIIGREIKPRLYHLELIGNDWGIYSNINGSLSLLVNISGTNPAIQLQAEEVIFQVRKAFKEGGSYDYHQIKGPRKRLRERYDDYLNISGIKRVFGALYMILEESLLMPEDRIEALEVIDSAQIEQFLCCVRSSKCLISMLVSGSMTEDQCYTLFQSVKITEAEAKLNSLLRENSSIILEKTTKVFKMLDLTISTVLYYIQVSERTDTNAFVRAKIFEYLMTLTADDELRKKKGLAYGVLTGIRMSRRTFGLYVALPSGVHGCDYIVDALEDYLSQVEAMLASMSEDDFRNKVLVPFIESLTSDDGDNNLASGIFATSEPQTGSGQKPTSTHFKEHWSHLEQILNGTYNFKSRNCEEEINLTILGDIKVKDIQEFVKEYISVHSQKRAALIIYNDATKSLARRKMAAKVLVFQLRQLGCIISEEDMTQILGECSDQSTYSDVIKPLQRHFSLTNQGPRFMKFRLKYMMGTTIRKTKEGWKRTKADTANGRWPTFTDYREIQRGSRIALTVSVDERQERLQQILMRQWE